MEWLVFGYRNKAEDWRRRADRSHHTGQAGHRAYALRQKATWLQFVEHAEVAFRKVKESKS